MNLRKADLNRDGKLSGRNELDKAFSRLDNYDRDGSSNSIRVERNGEQTALGRVVEALADSVGRSSTEAAAPQRDYQVALESIRRGLVTLDRGDRGGTVRALQTGLKELGYTVEIDGDFGQQTERALQSFQRSKRLAADGVAGPQTASALLRALSSGATNPVPVVDPTRQSLCQAQRFLGPQDSVNFRHLELLCEGGARGTNVRALQEALQARGIDLGIDGSFGPQTRGKLQAYQWSRGLTADGVAGPQTYRALIDGAPAIERTDPTPSSGNPIDMFPVAGGRFNVGYDANWNNFDYRTAYHNSDFSLSATDANHPNGHLGVDVCPA